MRGYCSRLLYSCWNSLLDHAIGFVNPPELAGLNLVYRKNATGGRENIKSVKNTAPAFVIPLLLFSDRFGSPSGKKH